MSLASKILVFGATILSMGGLAFIGACVYLYTRPLLPRDNRPRVPAPEWQARRMSAGLGRVADAAREQV